MKILALGRPFVIARLVPSVSEGTRRSNLAVICLTYYINGLAHNILQSSSPSKGGEASPERVSQSPERSEGEGTKAGVNYRGFCY